MICSSLLSFMQIIFNSFSRSDFGIRPISQTGTCEQILLFRFRIGAKLVEQFKPKRSS
jgi:hypothetical protein